MTFGTVLWFQTFNVIFSPSGQVSRKGRRPVFTVLAEIAFPNSISSPRERRPLDRWYEDGDISCGMKPNKVRLFVKPFCGWCHEAEDWLEERGVQYEKLDVISDRAARQEMLDLSGQTLAPVIEVDGEVLADFDTDQLEEFWKKLEKSAA
jgi:glutaredoxin 3